jgi:hypothetical protein
MLLGQEAYLPDSVLETLSCHDALVTTRGVTAAARSGWAPVGAGSGRGVLLKGNCFGAAGPVEAARETAKGAAVRLDHANGVPPPRRAVFGVGARTARLRSRQRAVHVCACRGALATLPLARRVRQPEAVGRYSPLDPRVGVRTVRDDRIGGLARRLASGDAGCPARRGWAASVERVGKRPATGSGHQNDFKVGGRSGRRAGQAARVTRAPQTLAFRRTSQLVKLSADAMGCKTPH